ncbi:MAG: hypothetical protein PUK48_08720 [Spirochaetales bacterium]|nr:hypothetical protein [Spirochaetales bacterium]
MKTNVIYKENSSQEAKFRPYFSRCPTNCNLYAYGANNPVHYIDPTGMFNKEQFASGAIQASCGLLEVIGGAMAEGVTVGVSTFAIVDGAYNMSDGFASMCYATQDIEYEGAISEGAQILAQKLGATEEQADLIGAIANTVDSVVDTIVTSGVSISGESNSINSIVKGSKIGNKAKKVLDTINNVLGVESTGDSVSKVLSEVKDYFKQEHKESIEEEN